MGKIKVLAVDTSCDETSVAILEGRRVLANIVSSQVELHKKWGGVVPDVARRAHQENLPKAYREALKRAKLSIEDIDALAVTVGPGLAIDLEVGLHFIKDLAIKENKSFIGVNHMEGHFLSSLALNSEGRGRVEDFSELKYFPALGLLVSGKHTEIVYSEEVGSYEKIGKTLDDAAGEAFDKFGRMLGFGYPAGPVVSEFAKEGEENELIDLPIPMEKSGDLNFSYSGLKTACLYRIRELREEGYKDNEFAHDFCHAFVESVVRSITLKLKTAIKQNGNIKSVFVGGGVFKNERLVRKVGALVRDLDLKFNLPERKYRGDNAVMIAVAALFKYQREEYLVDRSEIEKVDRVPRLSL